MARPKMFTVSGTYMSAETSWKKLMPRLKGPLSSTRMQIPSRMSIVIEKLTK
ncbi:hypothetical protein H0H87_008552, partial [Tephrocybe sp. NHM501043]